ncbi:putative receptor-like protein kinase [Cinnamomum micranthum f. kanehirae]|uniref:Putative receptor-like protein kinase n=1 Tax=Cinnamomum micranthum f. kanehirae TaxID=337451 RepID=A0A443PKC8_9MAGN|nr:putative receptor-like protein kinase [Cinnamomum micranthum f. kanehirae]
MLTGKRPSDDMFINNLNLHQFAKIALPERVIEIIDRQLLSHENEVNIRQSEIHKKLKSIMLETLVSLVKIGVSCSSDSPRERMEVKDVVIELHKVRDFYLSAEK